MNTANGIEANGKVEGKVLPTNPALSEKSSVGDFRWIDVLIPDEAGKETTETYYQFRTLAQYAALYFAGLYVNQTAKSPALRAAALGLLFPGAGLTAVGSIPSFAVFLLSTCSIPLVLFAWFGCGGVFFPILLWTSTAALSAFLARQNLFDGATYFWGVACLVGIGYLTLRTRSANAAANKKRTKRNQYLVQAVQENQAKAMTVPDPGSRELDLETLRFVQWFIELGLSGFNDWSHHDVIDQFQTAAVRYQLYETIYCLGLYQCHYAPGFHGYLSEAQKNTIYKSCTKTVMNFWKWEKLLGKFDAHDWDPIKKDNIMVTGYILQAIGIYENNTGDKCFRDKDALEFLITENARYKTNFQGLSQAVFDNMDRNPYCLYPCEPNWVYTPCNLVGIGGIVVADRALKTNHGEQLRSRFLKNLEEGFTEADGSILPIRSELTGFTIPGLCGVLTDTLNSLLCAAYLPHVAHRNWAMARRESIVYDKNGKLNITNLKGADKIDAGNYKAGEGCLRTVFAAAAAEFGDSKIKSDCLAQLDKEYFPVIATPSGSLKNKGLSTVAQGTALRARLAHYQDWTNMLTKGPPPYALKGPLLAQASFPQVLVAKAYSHDGLGLDLVLYDGANPGTFELGLERLTPGATYIFSTGEEVAADKEGKAIVSVRVDGRTQVFITPA